MNLSVTSGTGFIGSPVTAALRADGHAVRAHMRSIATADRLPAGAGPVAGDLRDAAWQRARTDEARWPDRTSRWCTPAALGFTAPPFPAARSGRCRSRRAGCPGSGRPGDG